MLSEVTYMVPTKGNMMLHLTSHHIWGTLGTITS